MVDFLYKRASDTEPAGKAKIETKVEGKVEPKGETKSKAELSNWDSQIAPIIDEHPELKKFVNFQTSKPMMRAVNGRYDKVMGQLKEDDPKAYESFKKFKNSSWAMANELKKFNTDEFDAEKFTKYQKDAIVYFNGIADSYDYEKGKGLAMNSEGHMMTREQYDKWDQTPRVSKDKASTTAKVVYDPTADQELIADYELANVSSGYKKLKRIDQYYKNQGLDLIQPITKSWVSTSLQGIDTKHPNGESDSAVLNMNKDILSHIGKHKTTQDPDLAAGDQKNANDILKQLRGKDRTEQLQIIKDYSEKINGMTGRMGYYGNATIYNKYKKGVIGQNLNYYPQRKGKDRDDYYNETQENGIIDRTIMNFQAFRGVDKEIRLKTLDIVTNKKWEAIRDGANLGGDLSEKDMLVAFKSLVDENGNIRSLKAWQGELGKNLTKTVSLKDQWGYEQNYSENTEGLVKFYNKIGGVTDPNYFVSDYNTRGNLYSQSAGDQKELREDMAKDKQRQLSANAKQQQVWTEAYLKLKKSYKKTFDDVNVKQIYDATLLDAGFGKDRNQALNYVGVNLAVDKNMKLKETTGPKQENVQKVFGLLFDENGNVDKENVTLFSNKDIKDGLNAVQPSELKEQRKLNEQVLKNFLKTNNDNVTMTFYRNTNVSGQSAYQFYNTKTKESMMVYAPQTMLGKKGVNEDLFTKTGRDPLDFTFKAKGQLDMPIFNDKNNKPAYKSAALKYDKERDSYVGEIWDYNSEGFLKSKIYEIPYGSAISVNDAQKTFLDFLAKDYRNSK